MSCFLLVGTKATGFQQYAEMLSHEYKIDTVSLELGEQALQFITNQPFDLVIVGETLHDYSNMDFIGSLVQKHPLQCCAAISSLPPEEFHEASEGLGILAQLPVYPTREAIDTLLNHLNTIQHMSA